MAYGFDREPEPRGEPRGEPRYGETPSRERTYQSAALTHVLAAVELAPFLSERFAELYLWPNVDRAGDADGCWIWKGLTSDEYGLFVDRGGRARAHRYALEVTIGPIGDLLACHKCNNKLCCRPGPGHVYAGTAQDNADDYKDYLASLDEAYDSDDSEYERPTPTATLRVDWTAVSTALITKP